MILGGQLISGQIEKSQPVRQDSRANLKSVSVSDDTDTAVGQGDPILNHVLHVKTGPCINLRLADLRE